MAMFVYFSDKFLLAAKFRLMKIIRSSINMAGIFVIMVFTCKDFLACSDSKIKYLFSKTYLPVEISKYVKC